MACNLVLTVNDPDILPTISPDSIQNIVYEPEVAVNLSTITATISPEQFSLDDNIEVKIILLQGLGFLSSPIFNSATVDYDSITKTMTITGPLTDVNGHLLGPIQYTASVDELVDIPIKLMITDAAGLTNSYCSRNFNLIPEDALKEFRQACTNNFTLTGTSGSILSAVVTKADGSEVTITSSSIPFNTNLDTTVDDLINNINNFTSTPNFTAEDEGTAQFKICADIKLGDVANGWTVDFNTTGDLSVSGPNFFDEGVTGKIDPRVPFEENFWPDLDTILDIGLPLLGAAALLFAPSLFGSTGLHEQVREGNQPVRNIIARLKGVLNTPVPNTYDPGTPSKNGGFDSVGDRPSFAGGEAGWDKSTFQNVFTTDPAWIFLHYIENTSWGLGNIFQFFSNAQLRLYTQLAQMSERNITIAPGFDGDEVRYTFNQAVYNNITRKQLMKNILSTCDAQFFFKGGLQVWQDRPEDPSLILNHSIIPESGISWNRGSNRSKYNSVLVSYHDLNKFRQKVTFEVTDPDIVLDRNEKFEILAYACKQPGQATRTAKRALKVDSLADPARGSCTVGPIGNLLKPGMVVRILDPWFENNAESKNAGRILSVNSSTNFTVSIPSHLNPQTTGLTGENIYLLNKDGTVHESTVVTFSDNGNYTAQLEINDPVTETPVNGALYQITDGISVRIVSLQERNKKMLWNVTFYKYDPTVYDAIDIPVVEQ